MRWVIAGVGYLVLGVFVFFVTAEDDTDDTP